MQIILEQNEIEAALIAYATSMIQLKDDQDISIDMKAGRGENGYSATLDIRQKVAAAPVKATRASTPKAVETKTAAEVPPPAKAGLFGSKPTVVITDAPKEDAEAPLAISSGEERVDPAEVVEATEQVEASTEEAPVATANEAEAPTEKPKSIFNFSKPAAAG